MKPGGGGEVSPEQASLVVQLNSSTVPHNYASVRGGRGQGPGTRHKLPLSPSAPRFLPARNISAVARPLPKIMTSPKKNTSEQNDHDFMEGIVEKRPKFTKHFPPSFQYVVHEHNYAAPQPPPTQLCSPIPLGAKSINNGISVTPNGLNRVGPTQTLVPAPHHYHHPYPGQRAYSRSVSSPMTSAANTGVGGTVSTLVPYRGPPSIVPPPSQQPTTATLLSVSGHQQPTPDDESDLSSDGESGSSRNLRRTGLPGTQLTNLPSQLGPQDDGEETETAPEDEDSVTRCICDFQHDDGYMICCDKCLVWQHVDCMGIERGNIPDEYRCEECEPRKVDKARAIRIQVAKRTQFNDSSDSLESARDNTPPSGGRATGGRKQQSRSVSRGGNNRRERGGKSGSGGRQWRQADKKQPKNKGKQKQRRTTSNKKSEKKEALSALERSPSPLPPAPQAGLNQLRQWIDSYEEAVTNHYSPELRARVAAIKTNGLHSSDSAKLSAILPAVPKCKVSLMPTGIKILVTTAVVGPNLPIIEVRGKYMLSKSPSSPVSGPGGGNLGSVTGGGTGGNSGSGGGSGNNQKWSPYVFHHRLSQADHTTEICVDTTTYGNDARFVRRSCRPNAELRHCIEKGALHLYIVSTSQIESKTEITLPVTVGQYCSCGLADKCQANHVQYQSTQDKRRRGRRRTMSESSGPLGPPERAKAGALASANISGNQASTINNNNNNISKDKEAKRASYQSQMSQRSVPSPPKVAKISPTPSSSPDTSPNGVTNSTVSTSSANNVTTSSGSVSTSTTSTSVASITSSVVNSNSKVRGQTVSTRRATTPATRQEERKRATAAAAANSGNSAAPSAQMRSVSPNNLQGVKQETAGKMTREERKMEAIMKAIERLEKDEARKQQTVTGNSSSGSGSGSGSGVSSVGSRARKSSLSVSPHRERYERAATIKKKAPRSVRETRSSKSSMRTRRGKHVQVASSRRSTTRRAKVTGGTNSKRSPASSRNEVDDDEDEEEEEEMISNSSSAGAVEGGSATVGSTTLPTIPAQSLRRTTRRNAGLKIVKPPTQSQSPPPSNDIPAERDEQMMEEPTIVASTICHLPDQETATNGASPPTVEEEVLQEPSAKLPPSQPLQVDTPNKLEGVNQISSSSDVTQSPNVSSSCLLVPATSVGGPLAPGFKFPRTKKNYMTSWFGTDASHSNLPTTVCGSSSPPRTSATVQALAPDCAKKRWLRQAISEDSDSPKQAEAVSPTEMAAPLKKRRFARESVSSDHSFTPPATPQADNATQLFDDEENSLTSPMECNGSSAALDVNHKMEISSNKEHETVNGPKTPPSNTQDPPLDPTDDYEGLRREMSAAYDFLSETKSSSQSTQPPPAQQPPPPPPPPPPPQPEETSPVTPASVKEEARVKRKLSISEYRERLKSNPEKRSALTENSSNSAGSSLSNGPSVANSQSSETEEEEEDDCDLNSPDFLKSSASLYSATANITTLDHHGAFKKGVGNVSKFSPAPTQLEQEREGLSDRLRREFGLFVVTTKMTDIKEILW